MQQNLTAEVHSAFLFAQHLSLHLLRGCTRQNDARCYAFLDPRVASAHVDRLLFSCLHLYLGGYLYCCCRIAHCESSFACCDILGGTMHCPGSNIYPDARSGIFSIHACSHVCTHVLNVYICIVRMVSAPLHETYVCCDAKDSQNSSQRGMCVCKSESM